MSGSARSASGPQLHSTLVVRHRQPRARLILQAQAGRPIPHPRRAQLELSSSLALRELVRLRAFCRLGSHSVPFSSAYDMAYRRIALSPSWRRVICLGVCPSRERSPPPVSAFDLSAWRRLVAAQVRAGAMCVSPLGALLTDYDSLLSISALRAQADEIDAPGHYRTHTRY